MTKTTGKPLVIDLNQRRPTVRDIVALIEEVRGDLEKVSSALGLITEDTKPPDICYAALNQAGEVEQLAAKLRAHVNDFAAKHGQAVRPAGNRVVTTCVDQEQAAAIAQQERSEAMSCRELAVQARLLFDHGHGDCGKAMSLLAHAFPSLTCADGVDPFDAVALAKWAKGGRSHGEGCAARFILSVWNPAALRDPEHGLPLFDLDEALGVWDRFHQQALAGWVDEPWWP